MDLTPGVPGESKGALGSTKHTICDVWVTLDVNPEHNDILRLDEVKRRKSVLINAY